MKIYHVETQQAYDELMSELEEKGYKWADGEMLNLKNYFNVYKSKTTITKNSNRKRIQYADVNYDKINNPNVEIIKYKAKGVNKVEKKCEKCDAEYHDNAKYCSWCGNKLVDEPKFKVGDYVTVYVNSKRKTTKIEKIDEVVENNSKVYGLWYDRTLVNFKQDYWYSSGLNEFRHARPSEIVEYKVALNFHKHGRKPFELKNGDLIRKPSGNFTFIFNPENYTKEDFLKYGWEFLKTNGEVNEWLEKTEK